MKGKKVTLLTTNVVKVYYNDGIPFGISDLLCILITNKTCKYEQPVLSFCLEIQRYNCSLAIFPNTCTLTKEHFFVLTSTFVHPWCF